MLALSDGIFAFAMTLLVISIAVPPGLDPGAVGEALTALTPKVLLMAVSIIVIGSGWLAHHRLMGMLQRIDRPLLGLNIATLGLVAFVPFPHQVLGDYPHEPLAYVLYAFVLGAVNVMATIMDGYVRHARLTRVVLSGDEFRAEVLPGLVTATLFALSIPLAFVLVELTPLVWLMSVPIGLWAERRARRPSDRAAGPSPDGQP